MRVSASLGESVSEAGGVRKARHMHRKPFTRFSIIVVVLFGSIVCYTTGFTLGITLFLVVGALLELAFWILALTSPD